MNYKKHISLFLLFMYFLTWSIPYMPFIEYELNKKYIAEVLCENKDKVEMHCNGKCHLKKQLKKANNTTEQQQQPQAPPPLKSDPVIAILYGTDKYSFYGHKFTEVITPYIIHYNFKFSQRIFHPPKT